VKVAVVSPYDLGKPGGVQDQAIRLVGWLGEAGHDAVLIGPGTHSPVDAVLLGPTRSIDTNLARAPIRLNPGTAGAVKAALAGFDVVHVHEPFVPMVSPAALRVQGPAKVATFHADPPQWVRRLYRYGRIAARRALRDVAVVTAVSPVAGSAIDGVIDYRIVPNGIDVGDYAVGPKEAKRVTFLGRDDARKGLTVMLDAWPIIASAHPLATLHVVGARRNDEVDGVSFLGQVSEQDKRAELAASVVHCAPNLGGESFGIVVLEAMASGSAIVASAIPAFEHVTGETGVLVTPGDADELAKAVIDLLDEPDTTENIGRAGRLRSEQFDGAKVAAQYIEAYEEALSRES
jgi:phosphatidylinositol alpha-mannosyltransferase